LEAGVEGNHQKNSIQKLWQELHTKGKKGSKRRVRNWRPSIRKNIKRGAEHTLKSSAAPGEEEGLQKKGGGLERSAIHPDKKKELEHPVG